MYEGDRALHTPQPYSDMLYRLMAALATNHNKTTGLHGRQAIQTQSRAGLVLKFDDASGVLRGTGVL